MIIELIIGLGMSFFVMYLWYITQPIVMVVITETVATAQRFNANNTYYNNAVNILTQIEYWWGPLMVIAIGIMWLLVATHRREWESKTQEF